MLVFLVAAPVGFLRFSTMVAPQDLEVIMCIVYRLT